MYKWDAAHTCLSNSKFPEANIKESLNKSDPLNLRRLRGECCGLRRCRRRIAYFRFRPFNVANTIQFSPGQAFKAITAWRADFTRMTISQSAWLVDKEAKIAEGYDKRILRVQSMEDAKDTEAVEFVQAKTIAPNISSSWNTTLPHPRNLETWCAVSPRDKKYSLA